MTARTERFAAAQDAICLIGKAFVRDQPDLVPAETEIRGQRLEPIAPRARIVGVHFQFRFDVGNQPNHLLRVGVSTVFKRVRDKTSIFVAELSHVAIEGRAVCQVDCLRQFHEIRLSLQTGGNRFAFGALVLVAESLVVEKDRGHSLSIETGNQIAQSRVGDLLVMPRHGVWSAFERVGRHVRDDESARLVEHVEAIANLQIVFPRLWSSTGFHRRLVPVDEFLDVQAVQNVFELSCCQVQTFAPHFER